MLSLAALVVGCAPAAPGGSPSPSAGDPASGQAKAKRIVVAMMGQPSAFIARMNLTSNTIPGVANLEQLINAALAEQVRDRTLRPQLAEAVPSLENGLWMLLPDGRMETTWRIREGARWHDGTPLTGEDLVFATTVDQHKDVPLIRPQGYGWVERVEAVDPRTVQVTWSQPYIAADTMFTNGFASPLPRHLLGEVFAADVTRFLASPYWSEEFVGTGPFTLRQWAPGAYIRLGANDAYVLGRPKLDEIEVRFIPDMDTLVTNLVAGAVDFNMGRGFTAEAAIALREQWPAAKMEMDFSSYITGMPQFVNPSPAVVARAEFRRALLHGLDRQQLVESLEGGLSSVADLYIGPGYAEYAAVRDSAVRYEYDPRRAAQILEELGYRKGGDGLFRDGNGERLGIELRSHGSPIGEKTVVAVADLWTRLGVNTDPVLVPESKMRDRDYAANFPGLSIMKQNNAPAAASRFHSSQAPLPENRYVGPNYPRYMNSDFDAMVDRYSSTIPLDERMQALRQIVRFMSENLITMTLFYDPDIVVMNPRLQNIGAWSSTIWDVPLWDVTN
jgi:peptide/nickel transport system substrate-binding protein